VSIGSPAARPYRGAQCHNCAVVPIYVTGHRNPDTDSIASAIGYAELLGRIDPNNHYVPVRLGDLNAQTLWVLERSGALEPEFLRHVLLRVRDVMQEQVPLAGEDEPVRSVGLRMARERHGLLPLVDAGGALAGVMTERVLARRYVRESRGASKLDAPTAIGAIVGVLEGKLIVGEPEREVSGRVWVLAMDAESLPAIDDGDVVVVGNRDDAQRRAIELGVALMVASNETVPSDAVLELARERGVAIACSPLDTYVSARMITLSAPSRALMDRDPLVVPPDNLLADVAEAIKGIHYHAAVCVDETRRPIGLVTRSDLVRPQPRRVVLVDHAEQAQSVPGVEEAEIVEILDHHHIGSIETHIPVRATFDPVGSTATLVIERFRQNGMEPSRATAIMLLGAILSDTIILNSPTTTERDHAVIEYLERVLALDAEEFGREMFEETADTSQIPADKLVGGDVKEYPVSGGHTVAIAQVETVGPRLLDRRDELLSALRDAKEHKNHALYALMVTDILAKGSKLLVSGHVGPLERAFGEEAQDGVIDLPGVMSRKKQVAPKVLAAF
jgi:manganese-dependent inorganic pyrophosphatase